MQILKHKSIYQKKKCNDQNFYCYRVTNNRNKCRAHRQKRVNIKTKDDKDENNVLKIDIYVNYS